MTVNDSQRQCRMTVSPWAARLPRGAQAVQRRRGRAVEPSRRRCNHPHTSCFFCMANHERNVPGRVKLTPPPAASRTRPRSRSPGPTRRRTPPRRYSPRPHAPSTARRPRGQQRRRSPAGGRSRWGRSAPRCRQGRPPACNGRSPSRRRPRSRTAGRSGSQLVARLRLVAACSRRSRGRARSRGGTSRCSSRRRASTAASRWCSRPRRRSSRRNQMRTLHTCSENDVRLAQKRQVGPCISVRIQLEKASAGPTSWPTRRPSHLFSAHGVGTVAASPSAAVGLHRTVVPSRGRQSRSAVSLPFPW